LLRVPIEIREAETETKKEASGKHVHGANERVVIAPSSGRFTGHDFSGLCRWYLDVYIDFLGRTSTAEKLAAEEEKRCRHDDHKDHEYGYDCGVAATTIVISHKIDPPLCSHDSLLVGGATV
jgi:hypothetical protein